MVVKIKTADEILNASKCGDIFSQGDEKVVKAEYRQMTYVHYQTQARFLQSSMNYMRQLLLYLKKESGK